MRTSVTAIGVGAARKFAFKTTIGIFVILLLAFGLVWAARFFLSDRSPTREYVSAVVIGSHEVRQAIDSDLKSNSQGSAQNWTKIYLGPSGRPQFGVSKAVISDAGEIFIVSEQYDIVVVLTPDKGRPGRWSCRTYPEITFNSACAILRQHTARRAAESSDR